MPLARLRDTTKTLFIAYSNIPILHFFIFLFLFCLSFFLNPFLFSSTYISSSVYIFLYNSLCPHFLSHTQFCRLRPRCAADIWFLPSYKIFGAFLQPTHKYLNVSYAILRQYYCCITSGVSCMCVSWWAMNCVPLYWTSNIYEDIFLLIAATSCDGSRFLTPWSTTLLNIIKL
jgi:hypothetical protein